MSSADVQTALRAVRRGLVIAAVAAGLSAGVGCSGRPSAEDYIAFQAVLRAEGKLRTEASPAGVTYEHADLVRNFERIALRHEADATLPGSEGNWKPNPLNRWDGTLNYRLAGRAVTAEDRAETARLMARIAGLTGLRVAEVESNENFLILITLPDERDAVRAELSARSMTLARTFEFWRRSPEVICVANNLFSDRDPNLIVNALVVIGSETSGLLRQACLHEEIVQALGLANDHPDVRPSIFNDDGEFALLTEHDENLLRILYDHRLRPGMSAAEAIPIVSRIVNELPIGWATARTSGEEAAMAHVAPAPPEALSQHAPTE